MAVSVKIEGMEELRRKLNTLPLKIQGKVLRPALREGAKIMQRAAKSLAPVDTGQLVGSLKVRSGNLRKKGEYRMVAMTGKGDYKGNEFYGSFVEYGHRRGKRTAAVANAQRLISSGTIDARIASAEKSIAQGKGGKRAKRFLANALNVKAGKINDSRQQVPAKPYLKPAFEKTKSQVTHVTTAMMAAGIEREAVRL